MEKEQKLEKLGKLREEQEEEAARRKRLKLELERAENQRALLIKETKQLREQTYKVEE